MTTHEPLESWDEAVLETALEDHFRGAVQQPVRRRFGPLLARLLPAAGIAIVFGTAFLGRDDNEPPVDARSNGSTWGLTPGARYTYRVTTDAGTISTATWSVLGSFTFEGETFLQCVKEHRGTARFEHRAIDDNGLWGFESAKNASYPGIETETRACLLPLPAGVTSVWVTTHPDGARLRASIEAPQCRVTVPGGEFSAIRVQYRSETSDPKTFETVWYAPAIGVVKRTTAVDGVVTTTEELVEVRCPTPSRPAIAVMADYCQELGLDCDAWQTIPPSSHRLLPRSLFAVTKEDKPRLVRVLDGVARAFAWQEPSDVGVWLWDEGWRSWSTSQLHIVANVAAVSVLQDCRAAELGLVIDGEYRKTSSFAGDGTTSVELWCRVNPPTPDFGPLRVELPLHGDPKIERTPAGGR